VRDGHGRGLWFFVRVSDLVELGVEDDGPGLADEERALVFERFYRGHSGRAAGEGSGLGLTVARRIVEAAGGSISAEATDGGGLRVVGRVVTVETPPSGTHSALEADGCIDA